MSRRNRDFAAHNENNNNSSSSSSSVREALILATMSLIGLRVDVHLRDGSVYSGVFHTATLDNGYDVVLKSARITEKGKWKSNIASGDLIDTLVILSGDLVQVVAKGDFLPSDGDAGNVAGKKLEAAVDTVPSRKSSDKDVEKPIESTADMKRIEPLRRAVQNENGFAQRFVPVNVKKGNEGRKTLANNYGNVLNVEDQPAVHTCLTQLNPVRERQTTTATKLLSTQLNPVRERQTTTATKLLSNGASIPVKMQNHFFERSTSAEAPPSSGVSTTRNPAVAVTSESHHSMLAPSTKPVPHISQSNKITKETKLNPGAKVFFPSFAKPVSANLMVPPTIAGMGYIPNNSIPVPVPAAPPEVLRLSLVGSHSSVPFKTLPYGNLAAGNISTASQFPQPIVGHLESRPQPVRFSGQYAIQAGPSMHLNPQSVGRVGQLVYVHPASQGAPAFPLPFVHPLSTQHQFQLPKHQGTTVGQAMQLCTAPSLVASGQPPYAILLPPLPTNLYIPDPGSNGLLSTKFQ